MPPVRPPAPTNVVATDGNVGSVTITWDMVAIAGHYIVYRADTQGQTGSVIGRTDLLTWTDRPSTFNRLYWYGVAAQGAGGCSALSEQDSGYTVPAPVAPLPPTGLSATVVP